MADSSPDLYFHPRHGIAQVKTGFCWPAFFFGSFWALARRAYPLLMLLSVFDFALWFLTGYAAAQDSFALVSLGLACTVAYAYVRGKHGNEWIRTSLEARGYSLRSEC